jgi:hypothetical protein
MFGVKPTKTEAIYNFLHASTHADLANRYHFGMEVQVNVAPDGGTQVEGTYLGRQWNGFQGPEGQVWKAIRIPWKANTEPEFVDSVMSYDLAAHADGIGMTGWNWKDRRSEWWGFDFDAIKGHAESHTRKLNDAELREVQQMVAEIPWVTVRRSPPGRASTSTSIRADFRHPTTTSTPRSLAPSSRICPRSSGSTSKGRRTRWAAICGSGTAR